MTFIAESFECFNYIFDKVEREFSFKLSTKENVANLLSIKFTCEALCTKDLY
jgi:hypothetical protein